METSTEKPSVEQLKENPKDKIRLSTRILPLKERANLDDDYTSLEFKTQEE